MAKSPGRKFEDNFQSSANHHGIFFDNIKDVYIPPELRTKIKVPKNKYDCFLFSQGHLLPLELKSTSQTSFGFPIETDSKDTNKVIKQHQIDKLEEAYMVEESNQDGLIPGFVFNFRKYDNKTFFLHILDFINFKKETTRKSISFDLCKDKGIDITFNKLRTNYRYNLLDFVSNVIKEYQNNRWKT